MWGEIIGGVAGLVGGIMASNSASEAQQAQSSAIQSQLDLARQAYSDYSTTRASALGDVDALSTKLREALTALGAAPEVTPFSRDELNAEAGRRLVDYQDDAARSIDQIASTTMAQLMTKGLDRSTFGNQATRELAFASANIMQDARQRAFQDALSYISGVKTEEYRGVDQVWGNRQKTLGELEGVYGTSARYKSSLMGNPAVATQALYGAGQSASQWNNTASTMAYRAGSSGMNLLSQAANQIAETDWFRNLFSRDASTNTAPTFLPQIG